MGKRSGGICAVMMIALLVMGGVLVGRASAYPVGAPRVSTNSGAVARCKGVFINFAGWLPGSTVSVYAVNDTDGQVHTASVVPGVATPVATVITGPTGTATTTIIFADAGTYTLYAAGPDTADVQQVENTSVEVFNDLSSSNNCDPDLGPGKPVVSGGGTSGGAGIGNSGAGNGNSGAVVKTEDRSIAGALLSLPFTGSNSIIPLFFYGCAALLTGILLILEARELKAKARRKARRRERRRRYAAARDAALAAAERATAMEDLDVIQQVRHLHGASCARVVELLI